MDDAQSRYGKMLGQRNRPEKRELARTMRAQMTPQESLLWQKLRANRIGAHFCRQKEIAGFIVDFYCHRSALVVEVDGAVHDAEYDAERDRILGSEGLTILRFTNTQVETQLGEVVAAIRRSLQV